MGRCIGKKEVATSFFLLVLFLTVVAPITSNLSTQRDTELTYYERKGISYIDDEATFRLAPVILTNDTFTFSVEYLADPVSDNITVHAVLEGEAESRQTDLELQPNVPEEHSFTGLSSDTPYKLTVSNDSLPEATKELSIETFSAIGWGIELFYIIDASNPLFPVYSEVGEVPISVLGHYKSLGSNNIHFERPAEWLTIAGTPTVTGLSDGFLNYDPDNHIAEFVPAGDEGYFCFQYVADKTYHTGQEHGCQGFFCEEYLMTQGDALLLVIDDYLDRCPERFDAYMMKTQSWEFAVGPQIDEWDILRNLGRSELLFHNYYCYDPDLFMVERRVIYDTEILAIVENGIQEDDPEKIFAIYQKLCEIWGGAPDATNYTVMIVMDMREIYAGEWDSGQGFSTYFGTIGQMIVHQMYHRWQGWDLAMPWDTPEGESDGFWIEGFNEFYCDKILTDLGYTSPNFNMLSWYSTYKYIRGGEDDIPILTPEEEVEDRYTIYYVKGAVFTYGLNWQIMNKTGGTKSLDDVLKHLWSRWISLEEHGSNEIMLSYLRSIIPDGVDDWWQTHVVDNEPLYLEFELRPPQFITESQTINAASLLVDWSRILDATSYRVYINGSFYDSTIETEMVIEFPGDGVYALSVRGENDLVIGMESNEIIIIVDTTTATNTTLDFPLPIDPMIMLGLTAGICIAIPVLWIAKKRGS